MSEQLPLVTVVICTYKRAGLVTRAIKSAQEQTYRNIEIVVVDDASPDNTREAISQIDDARIRYIRHDRNKGLPAGRNTGIRAANGEFVAFLDDDDEWMPRKIEKQLEFLQKTGCDVVLCASFMSGNRIRRHNRSNVTRADLRRGNKFMPGSGLLARASALKDVWFDESICYGEDWDALIRIAERYSIRYLDEPLYRVDEGTHHRMSNSGRNLSIGELEKRMEVLHKHKVFFGSFWFNHHAAMAYLLYFRHRDDKLKHLIYTIRLCGLIPVISAFVTKVWRRIWIATAPIGR